MLLRVKSVNETFIQSSRLNIIKIEIPKLKGEKKSSESTLDESRIFGEKMKNSIRQLTFLFYTFHLSPRVLLSRIRPAKIKRIPSKSFLLSFPPIEFPSRSTFYTRVPKIRHRIFRFIRRPTPSQFLPTRFSHRIDGIDGGSENWFNEEVHSDRFATFQTFSRRIDACASIWAEWARSTRLEREERGRERERLQPSSTGSIRDIATSRVLTHVQNISKRGTHVQRSCKFAPDFQPVDDQ